MSPGPATRPRPRLAPAPGAVVTAHIDELAAVAAGLAAQADRLDGWGRELCRRLLGGHRLLAAGNGGSAAEAQHLTAELVGRYQGERAPFSAIALHADTSSLTAIGNDYGFEEVFARQVSAHARTGDVLILLSTSGRSPNLVRAAQAGRAAGTVVWAITGAGPNPLADAADDRILLPGPAATVQEVQLVAVHALCLAFEAQLDRSRSGTESTP
ncbi:D-sedoheptulose-7-phosphate isomerase [Cryobacterium sp. W22_MBD10_FK3]|uniref:D-sedoheptulose-7-phosphate isomerase n=1 Tax=Cryobacterium sp. W22_MBD10_FK3 TaxID=3240273 RepID=UPI003F92EB21